MRAIQTWPPGYKDGWIEIGRDDFSHSFVRALDVAGMIWGGAETYSSLDEALHALNTGIAFWLKEMG
jgi:hypothetical protein